MRKKTFLSQDCSSSTRFQHVPSDTLKFTLLRKFIGFFVLRRKLISGIKHKMGFIFPILNFVAWIPRCYFCRFDLHLVFVRTFFQFPLRFRLSSRTVPRLFTIFKMVVGEDPGNQRSKMASDWYNCFKHSKGRWRTLASEL